MNDDQAPASNAIANLRKNRDDLQKSLAGVTDVLGKYSDVILENSSVRELRDITNGVAEDTQEMLQENRLLRLGVVGQVKAGKSSLLNLLLFNGEEVLPKAATPMTASLTHIVKSDRDEVEIHYYSHNDWEDIKKHASEFARAKRENEEQIELFVKASAELVDMVKKRGLKLEDYLGKVETLAMSSSELNRELRRLVGSEGKVTPLVKSVTIRSSQGVPDLDIVDTPGINDPISSRSEQANKMLGRCDAVLLLSYAGQFMDNVDVEFFSNRIPQEGIRHHLVICSKFDSALVDVSKDHKGDWDAAREDTEKRLSDRAREAIDRLNNEIASEELPKSDLIFASAMCAILGNKPLSQWTREELHTFNSLQRAYPDYLDQIEDEQVINEETKEYLVSLGNQRAIADHLQKVRDDKDSIISRKMEAFLGEKRSQALMELEELVNGLDEKRIAVRDTDIDKIKEQREAVRNLEEEITSKVINAWQQLIDDRAAIFEEFMGDFEEEKRNALGEIKGAAIYETRYKTKKEKKSGLVPWVGRIIGIGGYDEERVPYQKRVIDKQAQKEAAEGFKDWLESKAAKKASEIFKRPFSQNATEKVLGIVANEFSNELASKMDMVAVRRSVRESVRQIAEQARRSLEEHGLAVGRIKREGISTGIFKMLRMSDMIEVLEAKPRDAVRMIFKVGTDWLSDCKKKIDEVANQAKTDLVPATVQQLQDYLNQLENDIKDREFKLQRYGLALKELKKCRQGL